MHRILQSLANKPAVCNFGGALCTLIAQQSHAQVQCAPKARPSWPSRPPRQVRTDAGKTKSDRAQPVHAVPAVTLLKGRVADTPRACTQTFVDCRESRPAHTPASQDVVVQTLDERLGVPMSLSQRFAAGRTQARLNYLAAMHLFQKNESFGAAARPGPGMSAELHGQPVYIVSIFTRRGVAMADVLPLQRSVPEDDLTFTSSARAVLSCRQSDLECIGAQRFLFQKSKYNSSTLLFRSLSGGVPQVSPTDTWVADTLGTMAAAANDTSANHVTAVLGRLRPRGVSPAAAAQHVAATSAAGRAHVVAVRTDATYGLRFALDLPLPQQLDCRPWRCHTCGIVFTPTKQDVKEACPDVLLCESDRWGEVLMTRQFLLHVVGSFYESMNARSVRRSLVEYFTANTWALCGGERGVWFAAAVPRPNLLRRFIC